MSAIERHSQKFVGKVVSGGRVTVPKRIIEIMSITEGTLIECEVWQISKVEDE
ncbi:MAG: hypothetical protein ACE5KU_04985 [Nitrososphaerales archaeon]